MADQYCYGTESRSWKDCVHYSIQSFMANHLDYWLSRDYNQMISGFSFNETSGRVEYLAVVFILLGIIMEQIGIGDL